MFSRPSYKKEANPFSQDADQGDFAQPPSYENDPEGDNWQQPPQQPPKAFGLPPQTVPISQHSMPSQEPQAQQALGNGEKKKNWPFCKPILYHDIKAEIDISHQALVRQLYAAWWLTIVSLTMNMIGTLCILIAGINGQDFGIAIMYFFVISVLSFFLWYRPVYIAFKRDSSFYFWIFFFFGGWHIAFCVYCFLGFETTGAAGVINATLLFQNENGKTGEAVVCLISAAFWFASLVMTTFLFWRVYRHYRSKGHSFEQARNQAVTSAVQSDVGRAAVANAGQAAFNSYTRQHDEV